MSDLTSLLDERSIVVCCGSGGVGKTTTAAALGLAAARRGRRTCIITIDPARRLADALDEKGLSNEPKRIASDADGELFAVMLDAHATFDDLVRRYAQSAEQVAAILSNAVYESLVSSLSGTQEYMATEKLYELYESAAFDLLVVDTPPAPAALDFLDAPNRLAGFIDNRIFRLMLSPNKSYLRPLTIGSQLLLRTIARVAGSEIVDDAIAFFRTFEGMEDGFRERASRVKALLADDTTAFVLISTPRQDALDETRFFTQRLSESHHGIDALVLNRIFPDFGAPVPTQSNDAVLAELVANLESLSVVVEHERRVVAELSTLVAPAPVVRVPYFDRDVHDVAGLDLVARYLMGKVALGGGEDPPG